jgi:hypothetical protein
MRDEVLFQICRLYVRIRRVRDEVSGSPTMDVKCRDQSYAVARALGTAAPRFGAQAVFRLQ